MINAITMFSAIEDITKFHDLRSILVTVTVLSVVIWLLRRPSKLPPGPMSWPFIGSLPGLAIEYYMADRPDPHNLLAHMSNRYGKLFSLHIGSQLVVVANDLATVREVGQLTTGRPRQISKSIGGGEGKCRIDRNCNGSLDCLDIDDVHFTKLWYHFDPERPGVPKKGVLKQI